MTVFQCRHRVGVPIPEFQGLIVGQPSPALPSLEFFSEDRRGAAHGGLVCVFLPRDPGLKPSRPPWMRLSRPTACSPRAVPAPSLARASPPPLHPPSYLFGCRRKERIKPFPRPQAPALERLIVEWLYDIPFCCHNVLEVQLKRVYISRSVIRPDFPLCRPVIRPEPFRPRPGPRGCRPGPLRDAAPDLPHPDALTRPPSPSLLPAPSPFCAPSPRVPPPPVSCIGVGRIGCRIVARSRLLPVFFPYFFSRTTPNLDPW